MTPKHWIPPEKDKPEDGQLRIVKLANGRLRAAKWRCYNTGWHPGEGAGCYADSRGDGIGSAENPIVAVGAPLPKRKYKSGPSGPSGKNLVPKRTIQVPDELWQWLGDVAAAQGTNRNAVLNSLAEQYCAQNGTVRPAS